MKKRLNVDAVRNELSGGSAFFPGYKGPGEPAPAEEAVARTPVRSSTKRIVTRNSFEIYEDQMDSLRKLSFKEKMDGKVGSMSAMVRDAIDKYLAEYSSEK